MNLADVPKEKLSPMMQQYAATKEKYSDCILFSGWEISTRCF